VSPQRSNRQNLLEGTQRCLARLPAERITAREIAAESGANLASIGYHFGSKDELVTAAVIDGLDRWLEEIAGELEGVDARSPEQRFRAAARVMEATRRRHQGLAQNFLAALARAHYDPPVRTLLAEGFRHTRPRLAAVLGLGHDRAGQDAAGMVHAMFTGLLFQTLLDPDLAIDGKRQDRALARLRTALPDETA
jgi:AcrR family transcriptional regulator